MAWLQLSLTSFKEWLSAPPAGEVIGTGVSWVQRTRRSEEGWALSGDPFHPKPYSTVPR